MTAVNGEMKMYVEAASDCRVTCQEENRRQKRRQMDESVTEFYTGGKWFRVWNNEELG